MLFEDQNNFLLQTGKNGEKYRNQQTIGLHVLAYLKKIWICIHLVLVG